MTMQSLGTGWIGGRSLRGGGALGMVTFWGGGLVEGRGVNVVGTGAGSLVGWAVFGEDPFIGLSALTGLGVFGFGAASTGALASLCGSIGDATTGLAGGGIA